MKCAKRPASTERDLPACAARASSVQLCAGASCSNASARGAEPERWQVSTDAAEVYASFDVVVSQFALMFFPDRMAALAEMWRTLAPGGRLAVAVWEPIDRARGYQRLVDIAARQWGNEAANVLAAPFVPGDQAEFAKLLLDSSISGACVTIHEGSIPFPSVKEFIRVEVKGSPLTDMLSDHAMETLAVESERALAEFVVPSGEIIMSMDAHIATANKR